MKILIVIVFAFKWGEFKLNFCAGDNLLITLTLTTNRSEAVKRKKENTKINEDFQVNNVNNTAPDFVFS